jgi:hypothetical protein
MQLSKDLVVKRIAGSQNIPGKLRAAREGMRMALNSAHYGTFVAYAEDEQRRYICEWDYSFWYPQ